MAITSDDIGIALGRPSIDDTTEQQWDLWISDARLLIEARLGDLALLDQAKLDYVVREAVVAQIKHPDDATQVSVSVDDGQSSRTYRSGKGRVHILDEWWALLAPTPTSGAFSLDTFGCDTIHLPWCSLSFGATFCSCGADIAGFPLFEGPDGL